MRAVAVSIDPGYRAGLTILWDTGDIDLYQVAAKEGWPGRVGLGAHVRGLIPLFGRSGIGVGIMELGMHVHGHSRQSSIGLGVNAGVWCALPVERWEQEDPRWQKVKGWELEVQAIVDRASRANLPTGAVPDAMDSLGLLCYWVRRNTMRRAPWARDVQTAFKHSRAGVVRLTILASLQ